MRRKTNPLATLGAVIAVIVAAWLTGTFESKKEPAAKPAQDAQLQATLDLIERGGPFPYRQDGATFGNRERRLPIKEPGYYREYTVPTPGAKNRGARRIVKGKNGETWYTQDHYKTFIRLD